MGLADSLANYNASDAMPAPSADNLPSAPAITNVSPSGPPAPSGGALAAALQPAANPNPKLNRTFMSTLKGLALGFMEGNVPGAVQGAIDPSIPEHQLQQRQQLISAQTADALARARVNEINLQSLPQQLRDQHDNEVLSHVKYMTQQFGSPDQVFDNSSEAAHEALNNAISQAQASGGKVPLPIILSDSKNTYVWNAANVAQKSDRAFDMVHQAGILNSDPRLNITQDQWNGMSADDKKSAVAIAGQILAPVAASTDTKTRAGQIQMAKRQLATVDALPNGADKTVLLPIAQRNLSILNTADNDPTFADKVDEDSRTKFLQGIQQSNLPADLKKTYTNFINQAKTGTQLSQATKTVTEDIGKYQTETDAAKQKAADAAAASGGVWQPKVSSQERNKAELGENIAENAAAINGILARRPDLVGVVAGRYTNAEQMVGNNDPDISALGTALHSLAMASSSVHGFRSNEGVKDTENTVLNGFKNGPKAVSGALTQLTNSVQTFIDDARPSTYATHSSQGGALAYYQKQQQAKPQASAQPQGRAVRDANGNILGYTTDGKTMTPAGAH